MGALSLAPTAGPLAGHKPLTYDGQRVVSTEMAAKAFGASEKQIQDNYQNNVGRFADSTHVLKVDGEALKALKRSPDFVGVAHKFAPSLYLWTERGVARHAKILNTDKAWDIFEQLEDTYFRVRQEDQAGRASVQQGATSAREIRLMHQHALSIAKVAGLAGNQLLIAANRVTKRNTGFDMLGEMGIAHLVAPVNDPLVIPTRLGQDLGGMSAQSVNRLLAQLGCQWADQDHKGRNLWRPTPKGEAMGAQLMDRERSNDTGAAQQLMWPLAATLKVLREATAAGLPDDGGSA